MSFNSGYHWIESYSRHPAVKHWLYTQLIKHGNGTSANYRCSSLFFPARTIQRFRGEFPLLRLITVFWWAESTAINEGGRAWTCCAELAACYSVGHWFPHQSIKSIEHPRDVIPRSKTEENMFDSFCRIFGFDALKPWNTMEYFRTALCLDMPG